MTHMHADDLIKEMKDQQMRLAEEHHRIRRARNIRLNADAWLRHVAENGFDPDQYRDFPDEARRFEGAGMDDWHDKLAPGFEKREGMVQGRMIGRAILMAAVVLWAIIGIMAALQAFFPGAFA